MKYTLLESLTALFEASAGQTDSAMYNRMDEDIKRRFGINDDVRIGNQSENIPLARFIRLYACGVLLQPQYLGIGDSRNVTKWFGISHETEDDIENNTDQQGMDVFIYDEATALLPIMVDRNVINPGDNITIERANDTDSTDTGPDGKNIKTFKYVACCTNVADEIKIGDSVTVTRQNEQPVSFIADETNIGNIRPDDKVSYKRPDGNSGEFVANRVKTNNLKPGDHVSVIPRSGTPFSFVVDNIKSHAIKGGDQVFIKPASSPAFRFHAEDMKASLVSEDGHQTLIPVNGVESDANGGMPEEISFTMPDGYSGPVKLSIVAVQSTSGRGQTGVQPYSKTVIISDKVPEQRTRTKHDEPRLSTPLTISQLASVKKWPDELKDYVSMLSRRYIEGFLRIAFDECGLKSYMIHNFTSDILLYLAKYYAICKKCSVQSARDMILSENPPTWNYNKLAHLAQVIIPEFTMSTLLAPMGQTANCTTKEIAESTEYLGEDNLELIQDITLPINQQVTNNLSVDGSKPLNYNQVLKIIQKWNYSIDQVAKETSESEQGNTRMYTPPQDESDSGTDGSVSTEGLNAIYGDIEPEDITIERGRIDTTTVEYPAEKLNGWYVVDLDQNRETSSQNNELIQRGVIAFNEQAAPNKKFYFRGGVEYVDEADEDKRCTRGVSSWCWTWGGRFYNDYREPNRGDRGYMLINEHALDDDVLSSYKRWRAEDKLGDKYDSSAFGIVISGPDCIDGNTPGLIKIRDCRDNFGPGVEGRRDVTDSRAIPGTGKAIDYDSSMVPNSGRIPGMLDANKFDSKYFNTIAAINYSIFFLALIGKWNNNIKLVDGGIPYTDELVALMQEWFPVSLDGKVLPQLPGKQIVEHTVKDITTIGDIVNNIIDSHSEEDAESILRGKVFRLNGTPWRLSESGILSGYVDDNNPDIAVRRIIMVDADAEHRLGNEYEGELPALLFIRFPFKNVTVPVYKEAHEAGVLRKMDMEKFVPRIYNALFGKDKADTGKQIPDFEPDESGISWVRPTKSSGKNRRIGFNAEKQVFITGPETDGKPQCIVTAKHETPFPPGSRGTYVVTPEGNYNLWVVYMGKGDQHMLVYYVRNDKMRMFEVVGNILDYDKSTALLRYEMNGETRYTLGNIMGDRATLARTNDPYTHYVICDGFDEVFIDNIGLNSDGIDEFYNGADNRVFVGLAFMVGFDAGNNSGDDVNVGVLDWYSADTMEKVGQTVNIKLSELARNQVELPQIHDMG